MVDPTPDPIDQAYRDAETLLTEEAERSARRARILAAVAQDKAVDRVGCETPVSGFSSRYGWLVAASVMLVSGYLVLKFLPPQPGSPPTAQTAAVKPAQKNERTAALSPPAPVPDLSVSAPAAPTPNSSSHAPVVMQGRTASSSERTASAAPPLPAARIAPSPPIAAAPPPPPPAIAAAPPPPAMAAAAPPPAARFAAPAAPAPPAAAPAPALRADAAKPMAEIGTDFDELRAAAGAGRVAEVQELLDRHIPVDSADVNGETALMKSVREDQPATAALLVRYGASLDRKNNAGFSARDLAAQVDDPALKQALGLQP